MRTDLKYFQTYKSQIIFLTLTFSHKVPGGSHPPKQEKMKRAEEYRIEVTKDVVQENFQDKGEGNS